jgi:hypothetical protein
MRLCNCRTELVYFRACYGRYASPQSSASVAPVCPSLPDKHTVRPRRTVPEQTESSSSTRESPWGDRCFSFRCPWRNGHRCSFLHSYPSGDMLEENCRFWPGRCHQTSTCWHRFIFGGNERRNSGRSTRFSGRSRSAVWRTLRTSTSGSMDCSNRILQPRILLRAGHSRVGIGEQRKQSAGMVESCELTPGAHSMPPFSFQEKG